MTDLSQAESFITETRRGFKDGSLLEWGVVEQSGMNLIGTCAYSSLDDGHHRAEIGFALHRDWWGKGLMNELLHCFIPFGFDRIGLHRIEADVDPRNTRSRNLLERFGFIQEGHLRQRYYLNGEYHDSVIYGLLKGEFPFQDGSDR